MLSTPIYWMKKNLTIDGLDHFPIYSTLIWTLMLKARQKKQQDHREAPEEEYK